MSEILCIIDGMTDPAFQAELYPELSSMRLLGYMDTTGEGEPESLGCILRILGINSVPPYLRGYAEALGNDISVQKKDLILRGSWFALDENECCTVPDEAPSQLSGVNGCQYYPLEEYKSLFVFPNLAESVQNIVTIPPYSCSGMPIHAFSPEGCMEVRHIFHSQCSKERGLILWGQSVYADVAPFPAKAAVICGTSVVKGIAKLLKMTLFSVQGATGDIDTNLKDKAKAALEAAEEYPLVILHINGSDEASHRKKPEQKQEFLQKVDSEVLGTLLQSRHTLYVMSDHGSDPYSGVHLNDKQPVFVNAQEKVTKGILHALFTKEGRLYEYQ